MGESPRPPSKDASRGEGMLEGGVKARAGGGGEEVGRGRTGEG